ncbi:MAG: cellulase family glycosylhydrolase [Armatimonadota bacterium]|nr:cellulase family glycosylhydrolase [Armatimonadota bacterium]
MQRSHISIIAVFILVSGCQNQKATIAKQPEAIATQAQQTSFLGVCVLLPKESSQLLDFATAIKKAGFDWVQTDIPLSRINPREGVYDFNYANFEAALKAVRQAGLQLLLKFLGQADWISRDPKGAHADWNETLNLTPPRDKTKWQEVVRQVVRRYGAYCQAWQIGNEPDGGGYFSGSADDYMTYLEWTATAIRSVQPNAIIAAGELFCGLVEPNSYGDVLRKLVRRPDLFDVLSVHYPLAPPEHAGSMNDYLRAMREAKIIKPIWNTEQMAGVTCDYMPEGTTTHIRTEGGLRLSPLKAIAHSLALGCEKVFLFSWNYDQSSIAYRPDVQAECRVASTNLDGTSFVRKLNLGDRDLTIYIFRFFVTATANIC